MSIDFPKSATDLFEVRLPDELRAPLALDSPHSGEVYPLEFKPAQPPQRYRGAVDMYVDELFGAAPSLGLPLLACEFPRIFCDVNRAANDLDPSTIDGVPAMVLEPGEKARYGKGVIWMATPPDGAPLYDKLVTAQEVEDRVERYWRPYHRALAQMLNALHERYGAAYHLDLHSMQERSNQMHSEAVGSIRPDIVLSDREGTTASANYLQAAKGALERAGFDVRVNDPYKGAELVRVCGRPAEDYHSLQIEVNRRLYMNGETFAKNELFDDTQARLTKVLRDIRDWVAAQA